MNSKTASDNTNGWNHEAIEMARGVIHAAAGLYGDDTFERMVMLAVSKNPSVLQAILERSQETLIKVEHPSEKWIGIVECTECKRKQMPMCINHGCGLATLTPLSQASQASYTAGPVAQPIDVAMTIEFETTSDIMPFPENDHL
jgi:hypothetical protein